MLPDSFPQSRRVLYEDSDLIVFALPGRTDHVLITFGDMLTMSPIDRFYAETVAERCGISTVGFMAKSPHWYRVPGMSAALASVQAWLASFETRLVYGGSMGGYAALKHSAALGASHVLAMVPQWSIDPDECAPGAPGYLMQYRPFMANMGIGPEDVSGRVWLVWDDRHSGDQFHAGKILAVVPDARRKLMRDVGHNVTAALSGTASLQGLMAAVLADDMAAFARIVMERRRNCVWRLLVVLGAVLRRRPERVLIWYLRRMETLPLGFDAFCRLELRALLSLRLAGRAQRARDWLARIDKSRAQALSDEQRGLLGRVLGAFGPGLTAAPTVPMPCLRTFHGTLLVFDLKTQRLGQATEAMLNDPRYLLCQLSLDGAMAGLRLAGFPDHWLRVEPESAGQSQIASLAAAARQHNGRSEALNFDLVKLPGRDDVFFLRSDKGRFIGASQQGEVHVSSTKPDGWEQFSIAEIAQA